MRKLFVAAFVCSCFLTVGVALSLSLQSNSQPERDQNLIRRTPSPQPDPFHPSNQPNLQTARAQQIKEGSAQRFALTDYELVRALLGDGQDYIIPPANAQPLSPQATVPDGSTVQYTAFNGNVYTMRQFNGLYTAILMRQVELNLFTIPQVRELIEQADLLYEHYKENIQTEPIGEGLIRIAFVETCGFGCGFVGFKGIELAPVLADPQQWPFEIAYRVVVHEMGHNFDRYSGFFLAGPDAGHSWTQFWDIYISVYDVRGGEDLTPDEWLQISLARIFETYLNDPTATWARCVRDALCTPTIYPTQVQGGALLRIAQLHGPVAIKGAVAFLSNAIVTRGLNPANMTPEQKSDLLVESFSHGASEDLSCYFDQWRWPVSPGLRGQLASLFGTNPNCIDQDLDEFTAIRGDINDADNHVNPGATEVINGIDDDCDFIIDDLMYTESSDFPNSINDALALSEPASRIRGSISSTADGDQFKINLNSTSTVLFTLKSLGGFRGWLFLFNQGSGDWKTYRYVDARALSTLKITLDPGRWDFAVAYNTASTIGAYEATVRLSPPWPIEYTVPPAVSSSDNTSFTLFAPPHVLGSPFLSVTRFWVSNVGWVASVPGGSSYVWTPAPGTPVGTLKYREQIYDETGSPETNISLATPIAPKLDSDRDGIPDIVETTEGTNPAVKDNDIFNNARLFIMQLYRDFLGREGDAGGINFWTNHINSGSLTRAQAVDSFFNSPEFQGTVSPVTRLYFAYFLRIPDYGGLNFWVNQSRLGATLDSISQAFAGSAEFQSTYGSLNNTQFVTLVYQNVLGRAPDAGGLAFWVGQLNSGAMTRGQVMLGFSESPEYKQASFNKVYVTMIYVGMLRRAPEQGGFDFWVNQMNGGASGLNLIQGFLGSVEYHSRFLP